MFADEKNWPMRFNEVGETTCQNYNPDYLQNLAQSLGYKNYRVNVEKMGNSCSLVWLDSIGNFQNTTGDPTRLLPYDVEFWN